MPEHKFEKEQMHGCFERRLLLVSGSDLLCPRCCILHPITSDQSVSLKKKFLLKDDMTISFFEVLFVLYYSLFVSFSMGSICERSYEKAVDSWKRTAGVSELHKCSWLGLSCKHFRCPNLLKQSAQILSGFWRQAIFHWKVVTNWGKLLLNCEWLFSLLQTEI